LYFFYFLKDWVLTFLLGVIQYNCLSIEMKNLETIFILVKIVIRKVFI